MAAEEWRNLISLLSSRTGSGADDVVDGKGVGQPFKLTGRKDDFTEWTHNCRTFLVAKLGDNVASLLKWAQQQKKSIVSTEMAMEREVSYYAMFRPGGGQHAVADIQKIESRLSTKQIKWCVTLVMVGALKAGGGYTPSTIRHRPCAELRF